MGRARAEPDPLPEALTAMRTQATRMDRSYDTPCLGGYSADGRTIYLDRRLPRLLRCISRKSGMKQ